MRSKPESGKTLDRINREVRVANEILMDNAPEQTGYNTEMQRVARLARMEARTTETYYPWRKKSKSVIKIIKGRAKRRRVQRNIPKMV